MFLRCKGVRQVWSGVGLEDTRSYLLDCHGPKDMLHAILQLETSKKIKSVALLWTWWKHRNKINAGEGKPDVNDVVFNTTRRVAEYEQFCVPTPVPKQGVHHNWRPPGDDRLKVNIAGSFFQVSSSGGWGYVIRDSNGLVISSAAGRLDHVRSALQAEAEACLQTILAAHDMGVEEVVPEFDALLLVQAINSDDYDRAENGVLFKEIKVLLPSCFRSFYVKHCPRACNKVANALASFGSKLVHLPLAVW